MDQIKQLPKTPTLPSNTADEGKSLIRALWDHIIQSNETVNKIIKQLQGLDTGDVVDAISVGMVVSFFSENVPPGFLLLSGPNRVASFDPLLYPDLYAHLGTTSLPDCTNRFPEGAGDHIAGSAVKAWRLPAFGTNTTGDHAHDGSKQFVNWIGSGGSTGLNQPGAGNTTGSYLSSAGLHSHTLTVPPGNTDTYLAPDAFGVYWAIKAYGAVANEGVADMATVIADIANRYTKAESDAKYAIKAQQAWQAPALLNGWQHYNIVNPGDPNPYSPPGYYKDSIGVVHLRGLICNGSASSVLFVLPSGYRPGNRLILAGGSYTSGSGVVLCRIDIDSSGNVLWQNGGTNVYISLDGISFRAEA